MSERLSDKEIIIVPQYYYPTYGGLQNFTYRLCKGLAELNINVTIIAPNPEKGREILNQEEDYIKRIKVIRILCERENFWQKASEKIKCFPSISKVLIIGLEFENLIDNQLSFIDNCFKMNKEVFLRIATSKDFLEVIYKNEERFLKFRRCKKIITINNQIKNEIYSYNDSINTTFIPNIIDSNIFHPVSDKKRKEIRKLFGYIENEFIVLWTGRVDERKNLKDLLMIWSKADIDGRLLLAGIDCYPEKKHLNKLKKIINDNKIKNVEFIGPFREKEISYLYTCADVFVFTSSREGFCNSILEAAASGLPIICYNIPGVKVVLNYYDKEMYNLINFGNKNEFVKILKKYYSNFLNGDRKIASLDKLNKELSSDSIASKYYYELFKDTYPILRAMVIKPAIKCNCSCPFCKSRLLLYKKNENKKLLSLEDWKNIISTSIPLGLRSLHISGGEPTLFKGLVKLVKFSKELGINVNLNTNGILLSNQEVVHRLKEAGLDSCTISLYSFDPKIHDSVKNYGGAYDLAIKGVKNLQKEGIKAFIQTILTSKNMKHFDKFLKKTFELGVEKLFISYLEGGPKVKHPSEKDIINFKDRILPKCEEIIKENINIDLVDYNIFNLKNLFKLNVSYDDISRGIYNPDNFRGCKNRYCMALILANGDVHPCNAVEYFHEPVVGNVLKSSFLEIWKSNNWKRIRENGLGWCKWCPMEHHTNIRLK